MTYRCFSWPVVVVVVQEGGGRKGLPKSFLNRFMRVHVELLRQEDLRFIAGKLASLRALASIIFLADDGC